ncbi:FKBP-type peptidyl-prolyl cis-trans isomerase [Schaalia sp. 19OD2882]|uniref:FKBP-type peptidyl-prolyl cis-trans isomerase n=1 Tax=Schaalia sp. 19OD2882 TaxID=2794089 RepID=UPI001C1F184E|nr:FKBP-type peptidyl-prolyl cis-trans isomerase [Schaalia sp. 19OD2882]QWW20430.1 FKBP-type peptidyl-prolyl cis-trans isomerase [Schaalia sp. 19OD2882]
MNSRIRSLAAVACAALVAGLGLAACTSNLNTGQSGSASGAGAVPADRQCAPQSGGQAPEVDRSGSVSIPKVTGAYGEKPTIAPGAGETPKGIIATTLTKGEGAPICPDDILTVNYAGVLWDGTPFDSSFDRAATATFSLNQVIPGWKWGLAGQRIGDRVELVIPAEFGYGDQSQGQIPAGSTLVFVVDIISAFDPSDTSALGSAKPTGETIPGIEVAGDLGKEPKITFTGDVAPEEKLVVLATGTGAKIKAGDTVYMHGVAASPSQAEGATTWPDQSISAPAEQYGLVDQTVGSRVLLVKVVQAPQMVGQSGPQSAVAPLIQVIVFDIIGAQSAAG